MVRRPDPPRLLECQPRDERLHTLLAAGAQDVAPPDVLARSARRLSAALGVQLVPPAHPLPQAESTSSSGAGSAPPLTSASMGTASGTGTTAAAAGGAKAIGLPIGLLKSAFVLALAGGVSVAAWRSASYGAAAPSSASHAPDDTQPARPSVMAAAAAPRSAARHGTGSTPAFADIPTQPVLPRSVDSAPARRMNNAIPAGHPPTPRPGASQFAAARGRTRGPASGALQASGAPLSVASRAATAPETTAASDGAARARVQELRAVDAAHAALARDPKLALRRLRDLARAFPNGWLGEERAVLEVEALLRLGQRAAADAAFTSLCARYPRSPTIARLQRAIAEAR
jgi:hypothetical protein